MFDYLDRRTFMRGAVQGIAMMSVPSFLTSCAKNGLTPTDMAMKAPENPFAEWFGVDGVILNRLMGELVAQGADLADIYFQHTRTNWIVLEDGKISRAHSSIDQGVGLRVVIGDKTGYAFTEDLSMEAMLGAAKTARAIANGGPAVAPQKFEYRPKGTYYDLAIPWSDVGITDKLPRLRKLEALAKAKDPSIDKVTCSWMDSDERVMVVRLDGQIVTDSRPMTRIYCQLAATRNGETHSNSSNLAGRRGIDFYSDERLETLANEAWERTEVRFDARRPPAGEMPVALAAGASGILLHEAIGHGMEADFNRKGVSIYGDMIGKKVGPDFATIIDDGTIANERGALNYDDEGNACERTVLVENGVLTSYLHDIISSKHYGLAPTGSGRRQDFRNVPLPRMRCTTMLDGPHSRDEIIASMDRGIIAETFSNGQVDIGGGDFTFYIKNGWMVEGGKITYPIRDCNIIGNGPEALKNITMAAGDSRLDTGGWTCGKDGQSVPVSQGLPTVLVSMLTVGGDNA